MTVRIALVVACIVPALTWVGVAASQSRVDGGSGTYVSHGRTVYVDLANTGTVAWQFFTLAAPPGVTLVGGTNAAEQAARCIVGQPDGQPNEIECGPLSPSLAPPHTHLSFVVTLAAPLACGALLELTVSSTGSAPFTKAPDVAGTCGADIAPQAIDPPLLRGKPIVGDTITATPPRWSASPARVAYRWQRCAARTCTRIAGADTLTLRLTRLDAGRAIRLVAIAVIGATTVESVSKKVPVHARG